MLSFEQKIAIADTFPELTRKDVSLGRVNYHYEQSAYEKKTVIYHLHPKGKGFVYAGQLDGYPTDDKGFVNITDYTEADFRSIVAASIRSLTGEAAPIVREPEREEVWSNAKKQKLSLKYEEEDGMWYIFAGLNLDAAFETYAEAQEYLEDEGFSRI
ncbi:hypothetical protein [Cohnella nanjingensis]|uniref:Uncharacterized protein n=1 Tax=Cohnella nanjingensis TaxID=1387779 RepID=A0A7X0RWC4_9BACL|nr:hypothetical protein [Cohnella nanjingensis]MBB6673560.1 hypothetical protein [Cohnella nanjingensis]